MVRAHGRPGRRDLAGQSGASSGTDSEQRFFEGVFGIFGHGNVAGMGEALEAAQDRVRYYQARNEQAMVHIAAAFAKQRRRLRTFACTTSIGPGATNLVTGAANATVNRLPVLLLPGDRFATRRVKPVLQQLERPEVADVSVNDALRPVSRYFDRIERPEMLVDALPAAMRVLTSPAETGAVTVALPQDVQAEAYDWPEALLEPAYWIIPRARPDADAARRAAAERIAASRRPMIVAGGGVIYSDASDALDAFARRFGIPVTETQAGKGALPWDHPLQLGPLGSVGRERRQRRGARRRPRHRHRDASLRLPDDELVGLAGPRRPLRGDQRGRAGRRQGGCAAARRRRPRDPRGAPGDPRGARLGRRRAGAPRARRSPGASEWNAEVERVRHLAAEVHVSQPEVIRLVNEAAGEDGVVVCAAGGLPGDLHKLWRASGPETLPHGVRLFDDGLRDRWRPRRRHGGATASGLRPGRRRLLPHARQRDRHGAPGGHRADDRPPRQPWLPLHPQALRRPAAAPTTSTTSASATRPRGTFTGEVLPIDFAANAASLGRTRPDGRHPGPAGAGAGGGGHPSTVVPSSSSSRSNPQPSVPAYDSWWDVPVAEVSDSARVQAARRDYERDLARERAFV